MEIIDKYMPVEEIGNRMSNAKIIYSKTERTTKEKLFGFQNEGEKVKHDD